MAELRCCPVCRKPMHTTDDKKRLMCADKHSYDIARQGYVNLMPTPNKTGLSGDDREMMAARTRFLKSGGYQRLSDAIGDRVSVIEAQEIVFCDAGCGEGYYTNRLADQLTAAGKTVQGYGFDLSRDGVRYAAVQARCAQLPVFYSVASLFEMPLPAGECDCILNIFAPCAASEFHRILRPGGILVMAVPGKRHLWDMKCCLYETPYENEERRDVLAGFSQPEIISVRYLLDITAHREDLFRMTPYFWKTSPEDHRKLTACTSLETQVEFDVLVYTKNADC